MSLDRAELFVDGRVLVVGAELDGPELVGLEVLVACCELEDISLNGDATLWPGSRRFDGPALLNRDDSVVDLVLFDAEVALDTLLPVVAFDVPLAFDVPVALDVALDVAVVLDVPVVPVKLLTDDALVVLVSFKMFLPKALFRVKVTLDSSVAVDWPSLSCSSNTSSSPSSSSPSSLTFFLFLPVELFSDPLAAALPVIDLGPLADPVADLGPLTDPRADDGPLIDRLVLDAGPVSLEPDATELCPRLMDPLLVFFFAVCRPKLCDIVDQLFK